MKCAVIIPYRDRLNALSNTLTSLKKQNTKHCFETIVIDDGSKSSPQKVLDPSLIPSNTEFLFQENKGASTARNTGWKATNAEVIIFLDCDQIVGRHFVQNHVLAFDRSCVQFYQLGTRRHIKMKAELNFEQPYLMDAYPDERSRLMFLTSSNLGNIEISWHLAFSHNMSFRRTDLEALGGFDEDFTGWGCEDCELGFRAEAAGIPAVLNPGVRAYHQPHTSNMTKTKYAAWQRNMKYFLKKHPTVEVETQKILTRAMDPEIHPKLHWSQTLLQMEAVMRLTRGRQIQGNITREMFCKTLDDLHALRASDDVLSTRALISRQDIELIVAVQADAQFKEIRAQFI